jgi:hypothetical protein
MKKHINRLRENQLQRIILNEIVLKQRKKNKSSNLNKN